MGPSQIDRADRWFQRYGEPAVLFGRMIPLVRAFVSLPAGIAKMPLGRFTVLSLIGTIPWVLALALAGEALGGDWTSARKYFEYVDYAILALVVVGIVYVIVRRRRAADTAADGARARSGARPRQIRPPVDQAIALGLLQGPTELLPVSSSAHTTLMPWLAGWPLRRARRGAAQVLRGRPARRGGRRAGDRHAQGAPRATC